MVAGAEPDAATRAALEMAWKVCKHGKSNAIVLGDAAPPSACGFGQMSRVDSVELAILKAGNQGLDLRGCVAASDGFFPFPDGIEKLAAAGVRRRHRPGRLHPRRRGGGRGQGAGHHLDPDRPAPFQPLIALRILIPGAARPGTAPGRAGFDGIMMPRCFTSLRLAAVLALCVVLVGTAAAADLADQRAGRRAPGAGMRCRPRTRPAAAHRSVCW